MVGAPELWLIAGPNGAGKTTTVQIGDISQLIEGVKFVNPDDLALEILIADGTPSFAAASAVQLGSAFLAAANKSEKIIDDAIVSGDRIGIETVLSSDKFKSVVERVKVADGIFGLIYVGLQSPEISAKRIAARVGRGGHDVPLAKLKPRWEKSLRNLPWFLKRADVAFVFDNSFSDPARSPQLVLRVIDGVVKSRAVNCPSYFSSVVNAL